MQLRRVEKLVGESFIPVLFTELKTGDKFKLFDDGPEPFEDGSKVYQATTDPVPVPGEDGNHSVQFLPA